MALTSKQYKDISIKEFTKAAAKYESNHAGVYEMCKKDYPDILAELEREPCADLLDAGCGPASMISLLSEKYPERHYTGLDLTPAMIEQAKKKNLPNASFAVGDCENFPFAENSFDANMKKFVQELKDSGYEKVELIDTTNGICITTGFHFLAELSLSAVAGIVAMIIYLALSVQFGRYTRLSLIQQGVLLSEIPLKYYAARVVIAVAEILVLYIDRGDKMNKKF